MPKTTSRPMVRIHDLANDEIIDREMNDAEFAQYEAGQAAEAQSQAAKAQREADRAVLLTHLGITEEQAKLLLG
jgi:hypothetical protein